jgi:predicted porin
MRCTPCLPVACLFLAVAMPAVAQSNVTVSGYLDAGVYRDFDKTTKLGSIQRSNLAFAGNEDLGGGLHATFRLSTRFELDTGANEGAGQKPFWHDESTVGLRGGWGHVRLGRALTAMWAQEWQFDPWSNFNRVASPAWHMAHYLTPTDRVSNNGSPEYGRLSNGVFYDSPKVAGFSLHLSASPERTEAPGRQGHARSASLNYDKGAVAAVLAHERNGSGDSDMYMGGKVRMGAAAVMLAYDHSKSGDTPDRSRMVSVGATYVVGVVTLKTSYARQRLNVETNHMVSAGAEYSLSKRTMLYASLGHQRYDSQASRTAFGVGMAHSF